MKRNTTRFLPVLMMLLSLCFLCTACGEGAGNAESNTISPQDDSNEGLDDDFSVRNEDAVNEVGLYQGIWMSEATDQYDYIEFDADGNWQLYSDDNVMDEGYLWYDAELDTTFLNSYQGSAIEGNPAVLDGQQLYITDLGHFTYSNGMDDDGGDSPWNNSLTENDKPNRSDSWNSELYQRNVTELEGVWYYDEDPSASTYIVIDGYGNWSFYQRKPGETEGTEIDYGTFSYSTDEVSVYYAESAMYDGRSNRVFEMSDDILVWGDEGAYYLEKDYWYEDEPNRSDSWNSDLYQQDVSEFEGVWYYDEDPSASTYIVIDGYGNWSFYQRKPGETEGTEIDYGTFSYSTDEVSVYYAESAMYEGRSIHVIDFDEGILLWGDEGAYYRMN